MTVCIAAICQWEGEQYIIAAADRLLTDESTGTTYEPKGRTKSWYFAPDINAVLFYAGDDSAHHMIAAGTDHVLKSTPSISNVLGIVEVYRDQYASFRRKQKSQLGLVGENAKVEVDGLIVGFEGTTAHIYVVTDPGAIICNDGIGYVAIGAGWSHADSVFAVFGYDAMCPADQAWIITYMAKFRAQQLNKTIGDGTDMWLLIPGQEPQIADPKWMLKLNEEYKTQYKPVDDAMNTAMLNLSAFAKTEIINGAKRK